MNKSRPDMLLNPQEQKEKTLTLTPIGRKIMHNSTQKRVDSRTIVLIRKKQPTS